MARKPSKKPSKKRTEPPPSLPGHLCPNCGEARRQPIRAQNDMFYDGWDDKPHENPFDCIRHLRSTLDDVREDIRSIREDIRCMTRDVPA